MAAATTNWHTFLPTLTIQDEEDTGFTVRAARQIVDVSLVQGTILVERWATPSRYVRLDKLATTSLSVAGRAFRHMERDAKNGTEARDTEADISRAINGLGITERALAIART